MRRAAVLGVVAGCNQIFGLGPTDPLPDAAIPDANLPKVRLTWQVANTLQDGPDPAMELAPIVPAPVVRVGRIDGPLTETVYLADGTVQVPEDFPGTQWRLEYTIDGVAHELHWSPALNAGHATVPLAGRLTRDPVPGGGGYAIVPTGGPATHPNARVYTTGVWTSGATASAAMSVDYPFTAANSLSGPIGAPSGARGDAGVLVDVGAVAGCTVATGSASFAAAALMPGALTPVAPAYNGTNVSATATYVTNNLQGRLGSALMTRKGPDPSAGRTVLGHVPSALLPGFATRTLGLALVPELALPGPALLALVDCPAQEPALPLAARPTALTAFPLVVHTEYWDQRRTGPSEPFLVSGIAASMTSATPAFTLDLRVPFAIEPISIGPFDLGQTDDVEVPIATGRVDFTFALETGNVVAAHYYELVLYEVVSGASPQLVRRRVYTATRTPIKVDLSVLTPGTKYVFSIHAVRGRPLASAGDYTRIEYPQATTTIFTRPFIAR